MALKKKKKKYKYMCRDLLVYYPKNKFVGLRVGVVV